MEIVIKTTKKLPDIRTNLCKDYLHVELIFSYLW